MKSTILIINIFLLFSVTICAQNKYNDAYNIASKSNKSAPVAATLFINEHPLKKEQFTGEWAKGDITFENGNIAYNCNLRYNCWKDELIWLRDTDYKTGTVIKTAVKEFTLTDNSGTKKFIKYIDQSSLIKQNIYLEVLSEGNISLYCFRKVSYIKSSNTFTKNHQYFLSRQGKTIEVNLSKKSIFSHFTLDEQKALKAIISQNHLKIKKEYDLAKAIELFNKQK